MRKISFVTTIFFLSVFANSFLFVSLVHSEMSSTNYQISSDIIGSAEGESSSLNYDLLTNMGETGVGLHNSDNWIVKSGFLQTINYTISISIDSGTVDLGNLNPLSSSTGSNTIGVTTDAMGGYTLSAYHSSSGFTETLRHTDNLTYILDKTDWDPTANSGEGNAGVWTGTGLGFTVYSNNNGEKNTTWWGTGTMETDSNNQYAGFPTSNTKILETTDYKSGERETNVGYKVTVPDNQKSGSYSGVVTYIATINL